MLRLNVGAGDRILPGWTGVDVTQRKAADIIADARSIPLEAGTVDELMAIHLVEHVHPWEVPALLTEWARLLRTEGLLILEMPDLMKACENIVDGRMKGGKHPDQLGLWALYGDSRTQDPLMAHKYAWTFATLTPLVEAAGFTNVCQRPTQFHPAGREHRDFRMEARKA